jgi:hypothetical protein
MGADSMTLIKLKGVTKRKKKIVEVTSRLATTQAEPYSTILRRLSVPILHLVNDPSWMSALAVAHS